MLVAIVIGFALLGLYRLKLWLYKPVSPRLPVPAEEFHEHDAAVQLLRQSGYDVIAGKYRVPIEIQLDEKTLGSRYYIDYFARDGHELFVVKVSRERMPIEWTGSGIRDKLLPYFLLFEQVSGLLYVDLAEQRIRKMKVVLDLENKFGR